MRTYHRECGRCAKKIHVRCLPELSDDVNDERTYEVLLECRSALTLDVLLLCECFGGSVTVSDYHLVLPLLALVVSVASLSLSSERSSSRPRGVHHLKDFD